MPIAKMPGCLIAFGDPVVDIMTRLRSRDFLASIGADEGGSMLVSQQEMQSLRTDALAHPDTDGGEASGEARWETNFALAHACIAPIDCTRT